ncbi:quinohemoprotein amine dehydrogenase alpha subunit-like protein [Desulfobotulus alkaliphilus]|uniref:Quinohemoprotein amine dehydrogenase alpha subunit-like protein n=1 Tax=Desulfobotulus alkaliphilus TaxID=622671 RepID=A0A562RXS8_9BACT|nr:c-type cytochrome [Desulfobotulus alkaliphilus]TWI73200.1 quinohemoprotein amine dehydrogenase alpha subunit-like protein [Desulfobotulus alkaliphilus]
MKKKKTLFPAFVLIAALGLSLALFSPVASSDALAEGENLLQNRCTSCHGAGKITRAKKDRNGWERTVRRMEQKGVQLTDAERSLLIHYLATSYGK